MVLMKLSSVAHRFVQKNVLLQRTNPLIRFQDNKSTVTKQKDDDDEMDEPVKFLNSPAAKWNAVASRTGRNPNEVPRYQALVVGISTIVFLVYFCILREENDVDEKLSLNLSDHFKGEAKDAILISQGYALNPKKEKSTTE